MIPTASSPSYGVSQAKELSGSDDNKVAGGSISLSLSVAKLFLVSRRTTLCSALCLLERRRAFLFLLLYPPFKLRLACRAVQAWSAGLSQIRLFTLL